MTYNLKAIALLIMLITTSYSQQTSSLINLVEQLEDTSIRKGHLLKEVTNLEAEGQLSPAQNNQLLDKKTQLKQVEEEINALHQQIKDIKSKSS